VVFLEDSKNFGNRGYRPELVFWCCTPWLITDGYLTQVLNNCAILVWSTVDQGWAGTRNGTKLMSVLINNPSELFIPQWMIRSGETLSYPLEQTGNCKPYRRVIHAFMDEKFNSAASKLFHTSIIHPLVQSFSRALCASACVCGFAAFHCLSFPSPCSLAAIFHWFRGFKRFLLIVLGFICLFFYFFICIWSGWFLLTGVRSNSTRSKKLRFSRDLSFALLVWLNFMCLIYVFCVIAFWNSEKEEESVQSFIVLTFKQSKLSRWIDSRFLAVISSFASSVL